MTEVRLVVTEREALTPAVTRFVLRSADAAPLPGYWAGAHLTLTAPSGDRRSYSLIEPGSFEPSHYAIAVRREPDGRGGSRSLHDEVRIGDVLSSTPPANTFALQPAARYLLVAGGIGVTPIRAMAAELRARGSAVQVVYLSRTPKTPPGSTSSRPTALSCTTARFTAGSTCGRSSPSRTTTPASTAAARPR